MATSGVNYKLNEFAQNAPEVIEWEGRHKWFLPKDHFSPVRRVENVSLTKREQCSIYRDGTMFSTCVVCFKMPFHYVLFVHIRNK